MNTDKRTMYSKFHSIKSMKRTGYYLSSLKNLQPASILYRIKHQSTIIKRTRITDFFIHYFIVPKFNFTSINTININQ